MTTKVLKGFRLAATMRGDTLQRVAARELGDASRWVDLAEINGLRPPYLTDDESQVTETCKLTGDRVMVPASAPMASADTDPDNLYGRDIVLKRGNLQAVDGDLALIGGVDNYVQALSHLVITEPGELLFHPGYGCGVRSMIGASNSMAKMMLAGGLVRRAIAADPRTLEVRSATVTTHGDILRVEAYAIAVHESIARVNMVM